MKIQFSLAIFFIQYICGVSAWMSEGHLIGNNLKFQSYLVSRIAYEKLIKKNPNAFAKASELLSYGSKMNPSFKVSEGDYPFVESSIYADIINFQDGQWQTSWHYVNTPLLEKGSDISQFPEFQFKPENITSAIQGILSWLIQEQGFQNNFVYQTIMQRVENNEKLGQSYALRLLIHYVGDIHQPLHCISKVNKQNPKGDDGAIKINVLDQNGSTTSLHLLSDSLVQNLYRNETLGWAAENLLLGDKVYQGVKENEQVPDAYIKEQLLIFEQRLLVGGYRLAFLIEGLFDRVKSSKENKLFLKQKELINELEPTNLSQKDQQKMP
ncbi:s1 p1 nuclease [Stylonychia lemnae]|uniref:S1 p1 nuclease n=1 Tax=Stylonychia lemnae TaxID=5949 RepID=A0A078AIB9_STYLE|nr:s1 p1 nuclease [Stylonychia lemnae]|eukprot:CDW80553.1 s1 p1 nuclease [Stylonychia lemnae]